MKLKIYSKSTQRGLRYMSVQTLSNGPCRFSNILVSGTLTSYFVLGVCVHSNFTFDITQEEHPNYWYNWQMNRKVSYRTDKNLPRI